VAVLLVRFAPLGPPNDSYYGTAAQIIPILLVALAIEGRSGRFWSAPGVRLYGGLLLGTLAVGELSALLGATGVFTHDIYDAAGDVIGESDGPTLVLLMVTTAGLVGGFVGVLVVALVDPLWLRPREIGPDGTTESGDLPSETEHMRGPLARRLLVAAFLVGIAVRVGARRSR